MKTILTSIAAGSLLAALAAAQPEARYRVIDLGTLGGTYSFGFGINNAGDVAGAAATPAQTDGFAATAALWSKQKGKLAIKELGVLGPPLFPACPTCNSGAAAVDALGEVAMGSEIATLDPNGEDFGQSDPPNPTHRVNPGGHLEERGNDGASQPAGRQQQWSFLDQQSRTDERGCGEWHA